MSTLPTYNPECGISKYRTFKYVRSDGTSIIDSYTISSRDYISNNIALAADQQSVLSVFYKS